MATIGSLLVKIGADISDLDSGIGSASSKLQEFGKTTAKVGAGLTAGVTLPLVAVGATAIKASTDINAAMANIASLGVPTERVNELKTSVQQMAIETGKSTDDLAGGLYQVISAFGNTADTASILEINAKAAAAGLATTTDAINLTSAVTKGYGDTSAKAVQQASDLALLTVQLGQTTFPELAGSLGTVVPLAASLGVKMEDLYGVMATATGVTGGASEVATQFRGILQSLMAPTGDMTKLLDQMGYSSGQAMLEQLGLQGTIAAIVQAAEASGQPLQKYIGSIEGQTLALALAGPQADVFTQKLAAMQQAAGTTDAAFLAQTEGINATGFAMQQAQIKMAVMAQQLGDALAPALLKLLEYLTPAVDWLGQMAQQFSTADPAIQMMIVGVGAVAAALGPLLTILPGVVAAISAIGPVIAVLTGPIGLVVAAVAALALAWQTDFGGIQEKTAAVWSVIQPYLAAAGKWLEDNLPVALAALQAAWEVSWTAMGSAIEAAQTIIADMQEAFVAMQTGIETALDSLWDAWDAAWGGMVRTLQPVMDAIGAVQKAIDNLSVPDLGAMAGGAGAQVSGALGNAGQGIQDFFSGKALGGPVAAGVPYLVGEAGMEMFVPNTSGWIVPNDELAAMADGMGSSSTPAVNIGVVNNYTEVDLRALAYQVAQYQSRRR